MSSLIVSKIERIELNFISSVYETLCFGQLDMHGGYTCASHMPTFRNLFSKTCNVIKYPKRVLAAKDFV